MKNPTDIIKQARKEKRITFVELAKCLGVSQAYLVQLERGDFEPIGEQVELILAAIHNWPEGKSVYLQYGSPA